MQLRAATLSDADAVADVFLSARAGMTYLPTLHTDDEIRQFVRRSLLAASEVWVAEEDGRILGFAALSDDMLEHLYVHPDVQRRGVGSALLGRAKERRPEGLSLWVFQRNDGARRFYERHSFRLVELTDGSANEELEPDARFEWPPRLLTPARIGTNCEQR